MLDTAVVGNDFAGEIPDVCVVGEQENLGGRREVAENA